MGNGLLFKPRLERLTAIVQHQRGARQKDPKQDGIAAGMKQRQGEQPAAGLIEGNEAGRAACRGKMVAEPMHHSFRRAAGARGEDHVVELGRFQRPRFLACRQFAREVELQGLPVVCRDLPCRPEGIGIELHRQLALLFERKGGVERAEHHAAAYAGPRQQHIFQRTAHHRRQMSATAHSGLFQLLAQAVKAGIELAITEGRGCVDGNAVRGCDCPVAYRARCLFG